MRILHTSDWHLGKTIEGRDRLGEQAQFIDELCSIVRDEDIQMIMVAGDIYDTYNPPAAAEQLYYDAICRLADGGRRAVVVVAGNHDNPERISAASPLASCQGIILIGLPKSEPQVSVDMASYGSVRVREAGRSWVDISFPGCDHGVVVAALPYPSESRLKEVLSVSEDERELQKAYSGRVGLFMRELSSRFTGETVNLLMSHIYVVGGESSDSERPIELGGTCAVQASEFPLSAQYVALGHLHRPQAVGGYAGTARYSGSPLAYSFSEAGQEKQVVVVDVEPRGVAHPKPIHLSSGKRLVRWTAKGVQQVEQWCGEGVDRGAWVDLELHLNEYLTVEELHRIRAMNPDIVSIRPIISGIAIPDDRPKVTGVPLEELFRLFHLRKTGVSADEALVKIFLELADPDSDGSDGIRGEEGENSAAYSA